MCAQRCQEAKVSFSCQRQTSWTIFRKLYETVNSVAPNDEFNFFFYTESAIGLLNLREILEGAIKLSETKFKSKYRLQGVVFGSDDFCADIQATRTHKADELLYVRQAFVTKCKAFRLQAVDMVYIDYKGN
jgi:citrate lyase subunit beta-like protein